MPHDAEDLADLGYAVLTWTARGFGRSGGQIHLEQPGLRGTRRPAAAGLAGRPARDAHATAPATRGSAWSAARTAARWRCCWPAQDQRVDAIVPMITWNDLARSFLPESTGGDPVDGVFKKQWAGLFFGSGAAASAAGSAATSAATRGAAATRSAARRGLPARLGDPPCGRFAADVCAAYLRRRHHRPADAGGGRTCCAGPARRPVLDRIKAPTLLIQGAGRLAVPADRGRRQRPRHRRDRHAGAGGLVHRRARRRHRPADRPGPAEVPHRAVARPLPARARATRRRRASPTPGSPASTRPTAAWSPPATRVDRRTRAWRHRRRRGRR